MAIDKFRFISPAIMIEETDNSQVSKTGVPIGPAIIGRAERGPGMRPVKVNSFSEFVEIFGNPIAGGKGGDVWRDGNYTAPTYGAYAAWAWLKNESPITYVRLLGEQHTNATADGEAGWATALVEPTVDQATNGGAYGLFVVASSSVANHGSASLAAIFYLDEGSIRLSGTMPNDTVVGASGSGAAALVKSQGGNYEFKATIANSSGTDVLTTAFNFSDNSAKYIRRVFNTNPTLVNNDIIATAGLKTYWLGQTFDRHLKDTVGAGSVAGDCYGFIMALGSGSYDGADYRMGSKKAETGWFFAQDLSTDYASYDPDDMQKLFKFVSLDGGEWLSKNIKVSVEDVKYSENLDYQYGSFTVTIRQSSDNDGKRVVLETFTGCNLDPSSPNYVAKKIGTKYQTWDETNRLYVTYGDYTNRSKFVYVVMNDDVDSGLTDASLLPFGFYGPLRCNTVSLTSGSAPGATAFVKGMGSVPHSTYATVGTQAIHSGISAFTCSLAFPSVALRTTGLTGNFSSPRDAYWGIDTCQSGSSAKFEKSFKDLVYPLPSDLDSFSDGTLTEHSFKFSLDNLKVDPASSTNALYASTYRTAGTSYTASGSAGWKTVLDSGFDQFTAPLFGGFDGLDVTEKEPFRNTYLTGGTELTNYAYNTIRRAVDSVRDPEVVECNIMSMPGLSNEGLTGYIIDACEERRDSLAVIDLNGDYKPSAESTDSESSRVGTVSTVVSNLQGRGINSSYGCTYYSWVQVRDTINDALLWVPPSVVAIGAFAYGQKNSKLWFAPAGFNRGGLTDGAGGIPVVNVRAKLTKKDRDKLYEVNINPIASFPQEGIVIFGQKTLQTTQSALDRINVRRLMIYLKKEISTRSKGILFENNVQATWQKFYSKVEPLLASVKSNYGLEDFRIILDETTTTPDLRDRNIMYAKILLKPAKAIEYLAVEFNITSSGASFDD